MSIKSILVGIGAFIALLFAAFFKGRSSGKQEVVEEVKEQHVKDVEAVATTRVENVKVVNNVQKETINSSDSVIDKELADKWTRG